KKTEAECPQRRPRGSRNRHEDRAKNQRHGERRRGNGADVEAIGDTGSHLEPMSLGATMAAQRDIGNDVRYAVGHRVPPSLIAASVASSRPTSVCGSGA